jgi:hypothetical protein
MRLFSSSDSTAANAALVTPIDAHPHGRLAAHADGADEV